MNRLFVISLALAASASGAYTYYHTDQLAQGSSYSSWETPQPASGSVNLAWGGLTAPGSAGGSLISKLNVPDGTSEYEVRSTLTITATGGTYIQYLRASPDALSGPTDQGPTGPSKSKTRH